MALVVKRGLDMITRSAILGTALILMSTSCLSVASASVFQGSSHLTVPTVAEISSRNFKSFREWKTFMTSNAQDRIKTTQTLISQKQRQSASALQDPNLSAKGSTESGLTLNLAELQQQAEKDQYQLSVAKELTISDYFVGYLTKQKDLSAAIKEVSGRLTPDEVSELMYAYANNFFSSKPSSSISPARADVN